jgi:hypothetical protein
MFPLMIPILIGAAGGALANKKNPLQGAMLGAGIGATGGLLAPAAGAAAAGAGAAGAGAAGGAAGGLGGVAGGAGLLSGAGSAAGTAAADAAAMYGVEAGAGAASGSGGLLGTLGQYGKPVMQAASMMQPGEQQQQPQAQFVPQMGTGNQTLTQIAMQGQNTQQNLIDAEKMRRERRRGLLGSMYG